MVDPLCGRGTTLNQAVMYGFDAAGIDSDGRDVDAYVSFFTTWLKNKRAKHHVERQRLRRDGARARTAGDHHAGRVQGGAETVEGTTGRGDR